MTGKVLSKIALNNCAICEKITNLGDDDFLGSQGDLMYFKGSFRHKWPGHITMIWRYHVEEMSDLNPAEQIHAFHEFVKSEAIVRRFTGVCRINFVKFGNVCHHLHWHLIPRYESEMHQDKSPWELLDVEIIHRASPPDDPYSLFKSAMQL